MDNKKLYIGVDSKLDYFTVEHKPLTRGLALIGQSGCGKSFLLGRILEELVRTTTPKTRVLFIDTNADFYNGLKLKPKEKEDTSFRSILNRYNSGQLDGKAIGSFKGHEVKEYNRIWESNLFDVYESYGKEERFGFSFDWLLDNYFTRFLPIIKANDIVKFYRDILVLLMGTSNRGEILAKMFYERLFNLSFGDFMNEHETTRSLLKHYPMEVFSSFYHDVTQAFVVKEFPEKPNQNTFNVNLFSEKRVAFIEMERIQDNRVRVQSVLYILYFLWEKHLEMIKEARKPGFPPCDLKRTFLIIDEAHNFAPDETEDPYLKLLGELIHKIAAEGRKYGLHLILATQRPNKLKRGLLGELDNAIIMKMNSHSDLDHLANEMRILDVKLIEPCLHFQGQGNAIAIGEMTGMAPYARIFKAAPRRTLEGGIDIEGF